MRKIFWHGFQNYLSYYYCRLKNDPYMGIMPTEEADAKRQKEKNKQKKFFKKVSEKVIFLEIICHINIGWKGKTFFTRRAA